MVCLVSFIIYLIYKEVYSVKKVDFYTLAQYTPRGNKYENDTIYKLTENGFPVKIYICETELRDSWNRRSIYKFDGIDKKGQQLKETLIRYLTSRGLRKDQDGIALLSGQDVKAIESGIANYYFIIKPGIFSRLYQIIWEYKTFRQTGYLNAFSVIQRYDFWKASAKIIKQHFLIGVGTGNMNIAFKKQYELMNTTLALNNRWRSHNQYLSIFVDFGIIGFIWFLITLFYPLYILRKTNKDVKYPTFNIQYSTILLYFSFLLIIILSMFTEDTLETQAGVTFFAFFNSLFLFNNDFRKETIS